METFLIYSALVIAGAGIGMVLMVVLQDIDRDAMESAFDTERIDYIEKNKLNLLYHPRKSAWTTGGELGYTGSCKTAREAIDSTRRVPRNG